MYEKLEECPSCKHSKFTNYKICKDYSVSSESFALVQCAKCQLIFTNPRPDQDHIADYYKSDNYISHTNKANNLINLIYKQVRNITLRQKIQLIRKYTSANYLLDYGCGTGTFLEYCKKNRYQIEGYEPNTNAAALATVLLGTDVFDNPKHLKKGGKYDIITAWHVIEHVHDLRDIIKLLKKRLKSEGFMFLAVPNINSYDAIHYNQHWAAYDVPRHLYHFSKESFTELMKKCKLQVKAVHPMKFDSYYVSLLSEKYQTGNTNFLRALQTGRKSNKAANKNGEYSSLIYVVTK